MPLLCGRPSVLIELHPEWRNLFDDNVVGHVVYITNKHLSILCIILMNVYFAYRGGGGGGGGESSNRSVSRDWSVKGGDESVEGRGNESIEAVKKLPKVRL